MLGERPDLDIGRSGELAHLPAELLEGVTSVLSGDTSFFQIELELAEAVVQIDRGLFDLKQRAIVLLVGTRGLLDRLGFLIDLGCLAFLTRENRLAHLFDAVCMLGQLPCCVGIKCP
jgi:hypothetical protein